MYLLGGHNLSLKTYKKKKKKAKVHTKHIHTRTFPRHAKQLLAGVKLIVKALITRASLHNQADFNIEQNVPPS